MKKHIVITGYNQQRLASFPTDKEVEAMKLAAANESGQEGMLPEFVQEVEIHEDLWAKIEDFNQLIPTYEGSRSTRIKGFVHVQVAKTEEDAGTDYHACNFIGNETAMLVHIVDGMLLEVEPCAEDHAEKEKKDNEDLNEEKINALTKKIVIQKRKEEEENESPVVKELRKQLKALDSNN